MILIECLRNFIAFLFNKSRLLDFLPWRIEIQAHSGRGEQFAAPEPRGKRSAAAFGSILSSGSHAGALFRPSLVALKEKDRKKKL